MLTAVSLTGCCTAEERIYDFVFFQPTRIFSLRVFFFRFFLARTHTRARAVDVDGEYYIFSFLCSPNSEEMPFSSEGISLFFHPFFARKQPFFTLFFPMFGRKGDNFGRNTHFFGRNNNNFGRNAYKWVRNGDFLPRKSDASNMTGTASIMNTK